MHVSTMAVHGFSLQPADQLHLSASSLQPLAWHQDTGLTNDSAVSEGRM